MIIVDGKGLIYFIGVWELLPGNLKNSSRIYQNPKTDKVNKFIFILLPLNLNGTDRTINKPLTTNPCKLYGNVVKSIKY